MLFVAGPYELTPKTGDAPPTEKLEALAQVYAYLGYDLGYLAPEEADALSKDSITAPKPFASAPSAPKTVVLDSAGEVGFLLFPVLDQDERTPSKEKIEAVQEATKKLREKYRLVVGVSPWGFTGELDYLNKAEVPVDVLLGGGPGLGLKGKPSKSKETFWVRPYSSGKAVGVIDVAAWPSHAKGFGWEPGENIDSKLKSLDNTTGSDLKVTDMVGDLTDE